ALFEHPAALAKNRDQPADVFLGRLFHPHLLRLPRIIPLPIIGRASDDAVHEAFRPGGEDREGVSVVDAVEGDSHEGYSRLPDADGRWACYSSCGKLLVVVTGRDKMILGCGNLIVT